MAARRNRLNLPVDPHDDRELELIQQQLGIEFRDPQLLAVSLTHKSFLNEHPEALAESNERLEFLGDGVVNFVVAKSMYERAKEAPEGELTTRRSHAVRREALASAAARMGLGDYLVMGRGEFESGGPDRLTNLANAFEALAGAVFLDRGYDGCERMLLDRLGPEIDLALKEENPKDPKSVLQEMMQRQGAPSPTYRIASSDTVPPESRFNVEVLLDGVVAGSGSGERKVDAERSAAVEAMGRMSRDTTEDCSA